MQNAMDVVTYKTLGVGLRIISKFTVKEEGHDRKNQTPGQTSENTLFS